MTRRRSSVLVPAPLFISEGVLFFYSHPTPRCALELGPPHTVVIPWSEQFADNINSHPSSSWLATSAVLMQRGRGENIANKESRYALQVMISWTLRCGRSQRTLPGKGPSSYLDRPLTILSPCSAVRGHREFPPSAVPGNSHSHPPCRAAEEKTPRSKRHGGRLPGD